MQIKQCLDEIKLSNPVFNTSKSERQDFLKAPQSFEQGPAHPALILTKNMKTIRAPVLTKYYV